MSHTKAPPAGIVRKVRRALVHASGRDRLLVALFAAITLMTAGLLFTPRWDDALPLVVIAGGQLALALRVLVNGLRFVREDARLARRSHILAKQRTPRERRPT